MIKRLLIVTDVMTIGGVEKVIIDTLNGLNYSKFDVTLFILYKESGEEVNISKLNKKVKIQYMFIKSVPDTIKRFMYYAIRFLPHYIMNKLIVKGTFDVIITTKDVFTYPISTYSKDKMKVYKIMWNHSGSDYLINQKKTLITLLNRNFKRRTYKRFDKIILLTDNAKEIFCNIYRLHEKCIVLNNPINTTEIVKLSKEEIEDYEFKDSINLVCVSRLSEEKGVDRLLNSCNRLLSQGFDFNLIILGDGAERDKLNKIVIDYPILLERVSFLGYKANPYKYMRKCNLFISPSLNESFGLTIVEAMILGLPIIATYCSAMGEILGNGKYGLLVDNSEKGIYEGIKKMLSSEALIHLYRKKSEEGKEHFSYKRIIAAFEKIVCGDL